MTAARRAFPSDAVGPMFQRLSGAHAGCFLAQFASEELVCGCAQAKLNRL